MNLSSLLRPDLIHLDSSMADKQEIVRHLLGHFARH
jgi:hypothetical protein